METKNSLPQAAHGTVKSYLTGFFISLTLTSLSFFLVISHLLTGSTLLYAIGGLALLQAALQLIYFFHLGRIGKPQWEVLLFAFMLLTLGIIVCGSLWIMSDLHHRMML